MNKKALQENKASLGMLDQKGCSIKLESGELKFLNGSTVVMKWSRKNRLYVLDGEAVTGVSHVFVSTEKTIQSYGI